MSINLDLDFGAAPLGSPYLNLGYEPYPENGFTVMPFALPAEPDTRFNGAVYAENKKIYFVPRRSTYVLVYDTVSRIFSRIPGVPGTVNQYAGGVQAPNGKIYFIPLSNSQFLILDPETDTIDTTTITSIPGVAKWFGGCLAPNGKIYLIPNLGNIVAILDPENDTVDTTTIGVVTGVYNSGSLADNGKIYCPPGNGTPNALIIDTNTNIADTTTIPLPAVAAGSSQLSSCKAKDGKIYCAPYFSDYVIIIDPETDTADITSISGFPGARKWGSTNSALNGLVYFGPSNSANIGIVDVDTLFFDTSIVYPQVGTFKLTGAAIDDSGFLYFSPASPALDDVVSIRTGAPQVPLLGALSAYRNKL